MNLTQFENYLRKTNGGKLPLDEDQRRVLHHGYPLPLWIIAGPGTGKTHTLTWLTLKRILVDGVRPDRLILTTFTRKAAAELRSRLILSRQQLIDAGSAEAAAIDPSEISVGTLHSFCSQVLQDQRYEPTLRVRVLEDELVQQFFVRRTWNPLVKQGDIGFWAHFGFIDPTQKFAPSMPQRAGYACQLFNRMTENRVDLDRLAAAGDPHLKQLADAYRQYREQLAKKGRTDQAHLQQHLLDFLDTPAGKEWLGDGFTLLIDEYQDTNPIQEEVYFRLVGQAGTITVVGDDDQSLFRFRGATVESLVEFDRACQQCLKVKPAKVELVENRRSHPGIVWWVNSYIGRHPSMKDPKVRVRAPEKPPLAAASDIKGDYPPVLVVTGKDNKAAAHTVATMVKELIDGKLVADPSQVALLSFSTRESTHNIASYLEALRDRGLSVYNPRSQTAQKDELIKQLIGALVSIIDPDYDEESWAKKFLTKSVAKYIREAKAEYDALVAGGYADLRRYVTDSADAIRKAKFDPSAEVNYLTRKGGRRVTLSGLLYKLMAYEPFASKLDTAEPSGRLKALTGILAEYEALYDDGQLKLEQAGGGTRIHADHTLSSIYKVFVDGFHDGMNDPEDEEVSIQEGSVNVMTIHQSKGLQFEAVLVLRPERHPWENATHVLEDCLDEFATRLFKPAARRSRSARAEEDAVRLFFVAYSRAKRLLVLAGKDGDFKDWPLVLPHDKKGQPVTRPEDLEALAAREGQKVKVVR